MDYTVHFKNFVFMLYLTFYYIFLHNIVFKLKYRLNYCSVLISNVIIKICEMVEGFFKGLASLREHLLQASEHI